MKTKSFADKMIARNYRSAPGDIKALTRQHVSGKRGVLVAVLFYHRSMVADMQVELGLEPRARAAPEGRFPPLNDETKQQHLAALDAVSGRFYEEVLAGIDEELPNITAKERNIESNFARSSKSDLRAFIRAGNDVRALAPARVTKASLRVNIAPRVKTAEQIKRVMVRQATSLADSAGTLAAADKQTAIEAIETVMAKLAEKLSSLGVTPTKDPKQSIAEHRPFRIKEGIFWPAPHEPPSALAEAA